MVTTTTKAPKAPKAPKALPFAPIAADSKVALVLDWHIAIGAKGRNGSVEKLAPRRMFDAIEHVAAKAGKYAGTAKVGDYVAHFEPLLAKAPLPGQGAGPGAARAKALDIMRHYARKGVLLVGPSAKAPKAASKARKAPTVASEAAIAAAADAIAADSDGAHDLSMVAPQAAE